MKNSILLFSFVLAAGTVVAQDAPKATPAKPEAQADAAKPAHSATHSATHKAVVKTALATGEVVATDATQKTITFKNDKGESLTWPVEGKALTSLSTVKTGEKVTIAYRANEQGEPQAATSIKAVTTSKTPAKAPAKTPPAK